jgi:hypothetical protein
VALKEAMIVLVEVFFFSFVCLELLLYSLSPGLICGFAVMPGYTTLPTLP